MNLPVFLSFVPASAVARDAYGVDGPFYARVLHPLADPLQAALVTGGADR